MIPAADPIAAGLRVADTLDALNVASTVGGSIASSFAGESRSTLDIDIVAAIDDSHIEGLVEAPSADFYIDPDNLRRAIRTKSSANLSHHATQYKVDLSLRAAPRSPRSNSPGGGQCRSAIGHCSCTRQKTFSASETAVVSEWRWSV